MGQHQDVSRVKKEEANRARLAELGSSVCMPLLCQQKGLKEHAVNTPKTRVRTRRRCCEFVKRFAPNYFCDGEWDWAGLCKDVELARRGLRRKDGSRTWSSEQQPKRSEHRKDLLNKYARADTGEHPDSYWAGTPNATCFRHLMSELAQSRDRVAVIVDAVSAFLQAEKGM
eukprot:6473363-Amphidinium_carterae.2